ncbi:hypothetical protein ABZT47_15620 [Sphaerisporangium sp. NPDC005289]|uniref:hypothetical protein n=1 Tax=Sphaerisporangium sp. NPDC005289 TaxID=3155247 RepID=UPI0033AB9FAA
MRRGQQGAAVPAEGQAVAARVGMNVWKVSGSVYRRTSAGRTPSGPVPPRMSGGTRTMLEVGWTDAPPAVPVLP